MTTKEPHPHGVSPQAEETRAPPARRVSSADLLGGANQLVIEHRGQEYVLLVTRHGRLLLNARR